MNQTTFRLALAASCALALSACDGRGSGRTTTITEDAVSSSAGPGTRAPGDGGVATTSAGGSASIPTLAPVSCEGLERETTAVEQSLLVEAGPHGGSAFDAAAAATAVKALNPSTEQEWADAVVATVQGDHAKDACELFKVVPDLGDGTAQPTVGPGPEAQAVGTNHFALVLDASGSMAAASTGGTRMDDAKEALRTFVEDLPDGSTVSLRVYGHQGSNDEAGKAVSC